MIIKCKACSHALFKMKSISKTKAVFNGPIAVYCKECDERLKQISKYIDLSIANSTIPRSCQKNKEDSVDSE